LLFLASSNLMYDESLVLSADTLPLSDETAGHPVKAS
jgi:hypothetical protein